MAISNTLTAILPMVLARGLLALRSRVLMTRLVNTDYSMEAKKKGATIDVPVTAALTATNVTPAAYPEAPVNLTIPTVQISLSNWMKASFGLTDKELGQIEAQENFIPLEMSAAFEALASAINDSVFAEYVGVYGLTGTAGTTPFGAGVEVTTATLARRLLSIQKCPNENRRGVLDFTAEANALALSQFSDAEKTGSGMEKMTGEIGMKFGFLWAADDGVPTHTRGAIGAGDMTVNGVNAAGASSVSIAKGVGASWSAVEGDIFTIAGDDQQYVVTAATTVVHNANTSVPISPVLAAATSGGEAITTVDSHVVNLAFHRDAFALAMRAPDEALKEVFDPDNSYTMEDPVTGLVMRLEIIRMYKQIMWELDCLWGAKLVRPQYAVRIAG
jgi:hypothetical protein